MKSYSSWKKESKYIIIKKNYYTNDIISVTKSSIVNYMSKSGYFGVVLPLEGCHIFYINIKKCKFVNNLLKDAFYFDYNSYICRCRKNKLEKIKNE